MSTICFTTSPLLLVDYGAAATAVQKRLAVLPPPTPPSPPPLLLLLCCCWAAAVLLLSCCFCHIRVPLLRDPKKIWCCASQCQPIFFFFGTRFVFLWCDGISAIRSSQTDSKWCRNESGLFQVRCDYWLNFFYGKHYITALFVPFFGIFQIIFPIMFASFVPKLHFLSQRKRLSVIWRYFFR